MRRIAFHIVLVILLVSALCGCRSGKVIPRRTMTKIYAEMALADVRITRDRDLRRSADTMRVYGAILEKYGYTEQDFKASQEKYVKDAGRYVKMVKNSVLALEKERKALQAEKQRIDELKAMAEGVLRHAPNRIYLMDTLDLKDTVWFDFDFQEGLDTAFAGPELIVWADTVGAASSVDSTEVAAAEVTEELKMEKPLGKLLEVEKHEVPAEAAEDASDNSALSRIFRHKENNQAVQQEVKKVDATL